MTTIYFLTLFTSLVVFTSCNKAEQPTSNNNYYLKFKANGVLKEFHSTEMTVSTDPIYGITTVSLNGVLNETTLNGLAINFFFRSNNASKAGNRYDSSSSIFLELPDCYLVYALNSSRGYNYMSFYKGAAGNFLYPSQLNIAEYNKDIISGTFSGKVKEINGSSVVEITEGSFYIKAK
jgi:hypothetical protein